MIGIIVETYFGATLEETYESTLVELKWALHLFHITGQLSVKRIIGLMEFHQFKKEARCLKIKKVQVTLDGLIRTKDFEN